jgi:hypothetical protein
LRPDARAAGKKEGAQSSLSKMSHVAQKTPINSFQAKHLKGSVCLLGRSFRGAQGQRPTLGLRQAKRQSIRHAASASRERREK